MGVGLRGAYFLFEWRDPFLFRVWGIHVEAQGDWVMLTLYPPSA